MPETTPMVEYGVPIDAKIMVEPPDVAELELETGHPGLGDEGYVKRRTKKGRPLRSRPLRMRAPVDLRTRNAG